MAQVSIWDIKQELVVWLRNQDIITISDRGVTTSQDTGTFATDSSHTLGTNPTLVKNVRDVTVGGSPLTFGTDYTTNYVTGVLTFVSPQTGAYVINYDQGSTDAIYPDFPQPHLKISQFPRIAIDIMSGITTEIAIGAASNFTTYPVTIVAYDRDQKDVEQYVAAIRSALLGNKKGFYYFPFITATSMGPIIISPFGENKIFQRNQDFSIQYVYED